MNKETIKVELIDDVDWNINEQKYHKGQILEVRDMTPEFKHYAYYYKHDCYLDWIPREKVKIIK